MRTENVRVNNFNALRFMAAFLVIVSHGIELPTGVAVRDFAHALTNYSFSWYAVSAFFVISGYLITISWERKSSTLSFIKARVLRIWPGLIVMLLVSVPVLGIAFSNASFSSFMSDRSTAAYLAGCASILFTRYELPGVFIDNPLPAVNGSLWTLRYELICYVGVAIAGVLGLLRAGFRRRGVVGVAILCCAAFLCFMEGRVEPPSGKLLALHEGARLGLCFALGAMYREAEALPLRMTWLLALVALAYLARGTSLFTAVVCVATAYATFWLAFLPAPSWSSAMRGPNDYSYGLYIYAFPVQQSIIALFPNVSGALIIAAGFAFTLLLAVVSWHLVERQALKLKDKPVYGA